MQTGVFMESHLGRLLPWVLLFLLIHLCMAAPGLTGVQGEESINAHASAAEIANPFGSGEEDRRLLQSFIQFSVANGQGGLEINTHEQEVFYLFGVFDYDHSGSLDGLELMKLVSDYNLQHTPGVNAAEQVVSLVDFLLQSQDLNQDGLLSPLELLSHPLPHSQDSTNNSAPQQEQHVAVEEKPSNPGSVQETEGAAEREVEALKEPQPQNEENLLQEDKAEGEELIQLGDEQLEHQNPDGPGAEQGQGHPVPVHQGQPEI